MSKNDGYYDAPPLIRTLEEMHELSAKKSGEKLLLLSQASP